MVLGKLTGCNLVDLFQGRLGRSRKGMVNQGRLDLGLQYLHVELHRLPRSWDIIGIPLYTDQCELRYGYHFATFLSKKKITKQKLF